MKFEKKQNLRNISIKILLQLMGKKCTAGSVKGVITNLFIESTKRSVNDV